MYVLVLNFINIEVTKHIKLFQVSYYLITLCFF